MSLAIALSVVASVVASVDSGEASAWIQLANDELEVAKLSARERPVFSDFCYWSRGNIREFLAGASDRVKAARAFDLLALFKADVRAEMFEKYKEFEIGDKVELETPKCHPRLLQQLAKEELEEVVEEVCQGADQLLVDLGDELERRFRRVDDSWKRGLAEPRVNTLSCATLTRLVDFIEGCHWMRSPPEV